MTKDVKVKAPKKRKSASLDRRKARGGWLFVMPFIIGFILIYLPIVIDSIKYSFHTVKVIPNVGYQLIPVGWQNYNTVLFDSESIFVKVLVQGLTDMVIDIPMILIFSLFMAVLLNQKMLGRAAFRAIFFLPVIISTGLISELQASNTFMTSMGSAEGMNDGSGQSATSEIVSVVDFQKFFEGWAIGDGLLKYVVSAMNNIFDIVNRSGVQMLIFLAGLQSISPAIYESVQIDGASSWETFWKITFPMISPMILVNAVYTVIDSFTANSNIVMSYIFNSSFNREQQAAMSWMYFLVVILILALVAGFCSIFVFYQRRDK